MAVDVPQWLSQAFIKSVQAAGSEMPRQELAQACAALYERWSSPDRRYHDKQHMIDTLTRIETLLPSTHSPDLVRLAAWYHGAVFSVESKDVYTRNGGEDEHASAELAEKELLALGVAPANAERVGTLIRSLRSRESEASSRETAKFTAIDVDSLALRDAHLGCLAVEPQRYRRYLEKVREEYRNVPEISFCRARRAIIHNLLHRRPLFITPLARGWEEPARDNLEAEDERLVKKLKEMEALAPVNPRIPEPPLAEAPLISIPRNPGRPRPPILPTALAGDPTAQTGVATAASAPVAGTADAAFAASVQTPPAKPSKTPTRNREARENLLRYTAEEDAAEAAQRLRIAQRRALQPTSEPYPTGSLAAFSSLEAVSERVEADRDPKVPAADRGNSDEAAERKRKRREKIAAEMRRRISERQREVRPEAAASLGELRRQGYSSGSMPAVDSGEIATPIHAKAVPGKVFVAPTATSAPRAEHDALSDDALEDTDVLYPDDVPPSADTPVMAHGFHDFPGFGMEREPKDD